MAPPKVPTGSSAAAPGGRPRAQVAYEGEDEFSMMSLDPERRRTLRAKQKLAPPETGKRGEDVQVDELKSTNDQGIVGLFRKIFAK